MIKNTNQEGHIYNVFDSNPKAYVVSIFEIEEGHELPQTKNELINLMDQETLIPFHQRYCKSCHQIPGAEDWRKLSGKYSYTSNKRACLLIQKAFFFVPSSKNVFNILEKVDGQ